MLMNKLTAMFRIQKALQEFIANWHQFIQYWNTNYPNKSIQKQILEYI